MSNKKQTAVEWLAVKYDFITWMRNRDEISPTDAYKWRKDFLEQAKEMEKEQIIEAHFQGYDSGLCGGQNGDEYYKETYEV